jgi:Pyridoxamine 5'-phosphate oxidase
MPKLTQQELEEFLAEPGRYIRMATVDDDGYPRIIPIVFLYHEGKIKFTLRPHSAPWSNVRRDGRVAFALDEMEHPMRRVNIQGVARVVYEPGSEDKWVDLYRVMLAKTQPPESIEPYIQGSAEAGLQRPWLEVDLSAPTTRVKSWRLINDGEVWDRPVPMARQYIPSFSDSTPTTERWSPT